MLATRDAQADSGDEGAEQAGTQWTTLFYSAPVHLSLCGFLSPLSLPQDTQLLFHAAPSDRSLSPTDLCHGSPLSHFPEINYLLCAPPYSSGLQPFDLQPPAPSPAGVLLPGFVEEWLCLH